MLKWVLTLGVLGALAAAVAWYPLGGRTVLDRWRAAPGAIAFAERSVRELKVAVGLAPAARPPVASRTQKPRTRAAASARPTPPARPTESHTEEDRAALDRLLTEHASR